MVLARRRRHNADYRLSEKESRLSAVSQTSIFKFQLGSNESLLAVLLATACQITDKPRPPARTSGAPGFAPQRGGESEGLGLIVAHDPLGLVVAHDPNVMDSTLLHFPLNTGSTRPNQAVS